MAFEFSVRIKQIAAKHESHLLCLHFANLKPSKLNLNLNLNLNPKANSMLHRGLSVSVVVIGRRAQFITMHVNAVLSAKLAQVNTTTDSGTGLFMASRPRVCETGSEAK